MRIEGEIYSGNMNGTFVLFVFNTVDGPFIGTICGHIFEFMSTHIPVTRIAHYCFVIVYIASRLISPLNTVAKMGPKMAQVGTRMFRKK